MAKYKIYVNGNNTPSQNNNQIVQQLAQNAANQQIQAQAQNDAENDLRTTVEDIVKTKLLTPVNVPKFTTVQDILDAQKGQRLETFGKYLGNNPDITRLVGTIVGGTYMDRNGNFITGGEEQAQRQEAQMRADQAKAIQEQKEQNDLTQAMANAYNQRDIAEENNKMRRELAEQELQFRKEENALDRALKREGMAQQERLSRIIHGDGGVATGGAAGIGNIKMTAADRKSLTENKTTLSNIEAGLSALEANPKAYTFAKGILPADVTNRLDPKGVATRTQIDNITAVYRKWLTGAQMSDQERKAYERFLPAPTDNYTIVKAKLNGMKGAIERSNQALLSNYGVASERNSDPLGLGF